MPERGQPRPGVQPRGSGTAQSTGGFGCWAGPERDFPGTIPALLGGGCRGAARSCSVVRCADGHAGPNVQGCLGGGLRRAGGRLSQVWAVQVRAGEGEPCFPGWREGHPWPACLGESSTQRAEECSVDTGSPWLLPGGISSNPSVPQFPHQHRRRGTPPSGTASWEAQEAGSASGEPEPHRLHP